MTKKKQMLDALNRNTIDIVGYLLSALKSILSRKPDYQPQIIIFEVAKFSIYIRKR